MASGTTRTALRRGREKKNAKEKRQAYPCLKPQPSETLPLRHRRRTNEHCYAKRDAEHGQQREDAHLERLQRPVGRQEGGENRLPPSKLFAIIYLLLPLFLLDFRLGIRVKTECVDMPYSTNGSAKYELEKVRSKSLHTYPRRPS